MYPFLTVLAIGAIIEHRFFPTSEYYSRLETVYNPRSSIFRVSARALHFRREGFRILVRRPGPRGPPIVPGRYGAFHSTRYSSAGCRTPPPLIPSHTGSKAYAEMKFQRIYLTALQAMSIATFSVCYAYPHKHFADRPPGRHETDVFRLGEDATEFHSPI